VAPAFLDTEKLFPLFGLPLRLPAEGLLVEAEHLAHG
jgi:hypothetical protein